jgi:hypothetical protein
MKIIAIFAVLLLAACGPSEPYKEPVPQEVCTGKLEMVTGKHYRMTCEDGRIIDYTSYKYNMTATPKTNTSQIPE